VAVACTDPARFESLARKHGIRLLLQFGSTISGHVHVRSDVDVAVLLERAPASLHEYGALATDLQDCFPGRELDLAIVNRANPLFLKQIVDGSRLLYGSPRVFAELRMYAFKRYQDRRRFLAMEREHVRRTIAAAR
jgi:predicted nucleotidyltransferase